MKRKLLLTSLLTSVLVLSSCVAGKKKSDGGDDDPEVPSEIKSVSLDKTQLEFNLNSTAENSSATVTATIDAIGTLSKNVKFTIDNQSICSIQQNGYQCVVTPVSSGNAVLTVSSEADFRKTAQCNISVIDTKPVVTSVTVSPDKAEVNLYTGGKQQFTASVEGLHSPSQEVTWMLANSSDSTYASISESGLLTCTKVKSGYVIVKAVSKQDPNYYGQASVTIVDSTPVVTDVVVNPGTSSIDLKDPEKTIQFSATVNGQYSPSQEVIWSVGAGDTTYAEIDQNGLLTCKKAKASAVTVKATSKFDTSKYGTASVTIVDNSPKITSVTVTPSKSTINLYVSNTLQLSANVNGTGEYNKEVTWELANSSDSEYLTVDKNSGLVTAHKAKSTTAKVYARSVQDTTKIGTATITIENNVPTVTSVTMSQTSATLRMDKTLQLSATVAGKNNPPTTVTWTSSQEGYAKVNNSGLVTPVAVGTTTITATSTFDSTKKATCIVTVKDASDVADFTVMIYMCGADLESQSGLATTDISEMLSVGNQPEDVNVIIQTGGCTRWNNYSISSSYNQRYHVSNKSLVRDNEKVYSSYQSMGLTSTFKDFLKWGLTEYPADRTGVVLWNHGGGISGVCFDEKKNDDSLLNSEVKSAVSSVFNELKLTDKLEFIGYDACLMQVQDIAEFNSQYFNYMIASEESESGTGWAYDEWFDDLYAKQSTPTILKEICDSFIESNYGLAGGNDQTLSYLNLSYMTQYKTAWENFATRLSNKCNGKDVSTVKSFVKTAKTFDFDGYSLVDVKDFINKVSSSSTYNPGPEYTNAVLTAHSNLVSYSAKGNRAGNAYGLTMFYASNSYAGYSYTSSETNFTNWLSFNKNYGYCY